MAHYLHGEVRLSSCQAFFNNHYPLYLLIITFPKVDPLTATGMALCVDIGPKCPKSQTKQNPIPLSLGLSRIKLA